MLKIANRLNIHNEEILDFYVRKRCKSIPLITITNHTSCLDDPVLWGMLKCRSFASRQSSRWTLGAKELLFTNSIFSWTFSHGKVIPVVRGDGVYQQGVDYALEKLNAGEWVHVFPEGKVNMTNGLIRLKWGVGRLISECRVSPIVIPFWHVGMDNLLPNKKPYIPRVFKKVTVLIDEPMDVSSVLEECRRLKYSAEKTRKIITDQIQDKFAELKEKAEQLHGMDST